ncbi:MAG: SGNH/GDSL hydrolase family protein [Bacteroidaceae bacterium]|nr:SGNH/GDSL hydrolase family protein [Bacteroidaceae bacterium]
MRFVNHIVALLLALAFSGNMQAQKVLNVIGDSYVANHRRPVEEAWHHKMAEKLSLVYNNYGRNGSCVAFDRTHDGKFNFGPAMWVRYTAMSPDADYVLIIAGHNDADKVKENVDSLQMFADSLEVLLSGIEKHCPKAKIGYVTPWYVDRPGFADVCKVIKKVCKKHGVPVLMNYDKKCMIKVRDDAFRKRYFQGTNDTAHLNADGHDLFLPVGKKWFVEKVMKMKELKGMEVRNNGKIKIIR